MRCSGVIFDMDGVVVDNHAFHFSAWMEFSRRHRFPLNEQIYRDDFNGKTNGDLFRMIFGEISLEKQSELVEEKEGLYREQYLQHMVAMRGLLPFMKRCQQLNLPMALGTSAPPANVDFVLDHLDLRHFFQVIIDGSMVKRGKPDPEIYLLCAKSLGRPAAECIVFEDSIAGIRSGLSAGCRVVGVATSHPRQELLHHTSQVIGNFEEALSFLD